MGVVVVLKSGILSAFSSVNTDWNCSFKILASSSGAKTTSPVFLVNEVMPKEVRFKAFTWFQKGLLLFVSREAPIVPET